MPQQHLALAFGLRPDALSATVEFLGLVGLGGSGLGRRLEAIIGLVVASALSSRYMGVHHAQRMLDAGAAPDEMRALVADPTGGGLEPREREVARFCEQLTREPATMARSDVEALRGAGFDDADIVTIAASVSLENLVCRVADGVGLQLETLPFAPPALEAFQVSSARVA